MNLHTCQNVIYWTVHTQFATRLCQQEDTSWHYSNFDYQHFKKWWSQSVLSFINSEPFVYIKINNSVTTHLNKLSTKLLFGWLHHCKQETTLHCDWRLAFTASWACSLAQPRTLLSHAALPSHAPLLSYCCTTPYNNVTRSVITQRRLTQQGYCRHWCVTWPWCVAVYSTISARRRRWRPV